VIIRASGIDQQDKNFALFVKGKQALTPKCRGQQR